MASHPAQAIAQHLPFLRRYGRALTGSQRDGDDLVKRCLERIVGNPSLVDLKEIRISLYRELSRVWAKAAPPEIEVGSRVEDAGIVAERIAHLAAARRQLLLLTTLEGFSIAQAAAVLSLDEEAARHELAAAKQEMRSQPPTRILIIEDEPIIALDIQATVEQSGHTVVGIATTHREAVDLAFAERPGLVLADIQLSDDSSGIDAAREILEHYDVPVIFITAFPDRLLTGERPEPTFLITKPFDPEILNVSISQALATAS